MAKLSEVRIGVIGVGGMGSSHAQRVEKGEFSRCRLAAVCDINPKAMERYGAGVLRFGSAKEIVNSGAVDAVVIATPHYDHTVSGVMALKKGLHVLIEKPMSVTKADCEKLIRAHKNKDQVFAIMFNQRTDPNYRKIKEWIDGGELGELVRVNWIITNWFRTNAYYRSSSWRATWEGEGGGVLVNQSPHQLDLIQWLCGMPSKVSAFCQFGKYHPIEVEDQVTAYLEYPNGATGVFITSTGEAPGTNRLEIIGDKAKIVVEGGMISLSRNEMGAAQFCRESKEGFAAPKTTKEDIRVEGNGGQHGEIIQNFVNSILDGTPLMAQGREGIRSVELANAMLLSSLTGKSVKLPLNGRVVDAALQKLIVKARKTKKA